MLQSSTRGFVGKGKLIGQVRGGAVKPFEFGNVKSVSLKIDVERKARVDYQAAGGGELDILERITAVSGELTGDDWKPTNLARALRGSVSDVVAGAVAAEAHTAFAGSRVFADYIPDPDNTMTVAIAVTAAWAGTTAVALGYQIVDGTHLYEVTTAGTTGGSEPTWPTDGTTVTDGTAVWKDLGTTTLVEGTHWQRTASGVEALAAGTQFSETGTAVTLAYTKNPGYIIQALTDAGTEFLLVFDGLNENDSGNPVIGRMHRVKFSPTSGLDLIGDDFGEIKLSFSLLKDETITAAGLSQYIAISMV